MALKTLIVEDEPLVRERIRALASEHSGVGEIAECGSGREALDLISDLKPDLLFLDIQMPGLDGLQLLRQLGDGRIPPAVIFVTAFEKYALDAFDIEAVDYLLKPLSSEKFQRAVDRAVKRIGSLSATEEADQSSEELLSDRITASLGDGSLVFIRLEEVISISAAGNYCEVRDSQGTVALISSGIGRLESRLTSDSFVRIHRSHIVNLDHVRKVAVLDHGDMDIQLSDGRVLRSSRSYAPELRKRFS